MDINTQNPHLWLHIFSRAMADDGLGFIHTTGGMMKSILRIKYGHWLPRVLKVRCVVIFPFMFFADSKEVADAAGLWTRYFEYALMAMDFGCVRFCFSFIGYYLAGRFAGYDHHTSINYVPWVFRVTFKLNKNKAVQTAKRDMLGEEEPEPWAFI